MFPGLLPFPAPGIGIFSPDPEGCRGFVFVFLTNGRACENLRGLPYNRFLCGPENFHQAIIGITLCLVVRYPSALSENLESLPFHTFDAWQCYPPFF